MEVGRDGLVVPLQFAGARIEREQRVGIQIVAEARVQIQIRREIGNRPINGKHGKEMTLPVILLDLASSRSPAVKANAKSTSETLTNTLSP